MKDDEYRQIQATNWSSLKHMRRSPLHYRHELTKERAETPAMRIGTAIHCLVLEPDLYCERFAIWAGGRRYGAAWTEWCAEHSGKMILNEQENAEAAGAAAAVLQAAGSYFGRGTAEEAISWIDPATGMPCKARVDLHHDCLVELKSTATLDEGAFKSKAAKFGYHGQVAFYHDGLEALGHRMDDPPMIIVVEYTPPFDVIPFEVPPHVVDAGRSLYRQLLERLRECQQTDKWPGCAPGVQVFELPQWAMDEAEGPVNIDWGA